MQTQALLGVEQTKIQRSDIKGSDNKINQVKPKSGVVTNMLSWRRALQSPIDEEKEKEDVGAEVRGEILLQTVCSKSAVIGISWGVQCPGCVTAYREQGSPLGAFSEKFPCSAIDFCNNNDNNKAGRSFLDLSKALEQRNDGGCAYERRIKPCFKISSLCKVTSGKE